jgi:hypothetical protein
LRRRLRLSGVAAPFEGLQILSLLLDDVHLKTKRKYEEEPSWSGGKRS